MSFKSKVSKFNNRLAVLLTNVVSTMWCSYAFGILALVSLPTALTLGTGAIVSWIAQTFLQLVLLSVIMVGQEVQNKKSERRAIQDHAMLIAQLAEIKEMNESLRLLLDHHDI
jgi:hypothetical protein